MKTTQDYIDDVLLGLTGLIMSNLKGAAHQQYFPCADPDEMDSRIEQGKANVARLRRLREEFENISTGVV